MRISVDKNDTHYDDAIARYVRVFVNGYEQTRVITVDEERRYVIRYKRPWRLNHKGEFRCERIYGEVRIEFRAGMPAWMPRRIRAIRSADVCTEQLPCHNCHI